MITPRLEKPTAAHRAVVARNVILDGRLALFHESDRWLTVADLHFGYELSQRAAGNLFPLWGMQTIEARLMELVRDYDPAQLILLGDLVHNKSGGAELERLLRKLKEKCDVILIAGNHDRHLPADNFVDSWQCGDFHFHHGHCKNEIKSGIQIVGHHHPAVTIRDGAGLRLKLPAFIQEETWWIMPAFSPWAAGTEWTGGEQAARWLCSPQRVLKITGPAEESADPDRK
jgi:DNA ligase-associated metallophosphoesterase